MVKQAFNPEGVFVYIPRENRRRVVQDLCLDEQYLVAPIIEYAFSKFGEDLNRLTRGKFTLGPTKLRDVSNNKIAGELGGQETLITDVIRAKEESDSTGGIIVVREVVEPEGQAHELLRRHGASCQLVTDHFAEPKFETGYRCLNSNIKFGLQSAIDRIKSAPPEDVPADVLRAVENLSLEFLDTVKEYDALAAGKDVIGVTVELQVVHSAMEQIYDHTHGHMRAAQEIANKYRNQRIPNDEAIRMSKHYGICKLCNGRAAREAMLDMLLDNPKSGLDIEAERDLDTFIKRM